MEVRLQELKGQEGSLYSFTITEYYSVMSMTHITDA